MSYQKALLLFGLGHNFDEEQLKKAYYNLMKKYHPDLYESKEQTEREKFEELTKEINEAYSVLLKSLKSTHKSNNYYDFNLENKKAEFIKYFKDILENVNQKIDYKFRKQEKDIITLTIYNIRKAQSMQELQNAFEKGKDDLDSNNILLFESYLASYMSKCQKFFLQVNLIIKAYKKTLVYKKSVTEVYEHFRKMQEEIQETVEYYQRIYKEQIQKRVSTIIEMVLNSNSDFINKLSKKDVSLLKKALLDEKEEFVFSLLCMAERNQTNTIDSEIDYDYSGICTKLEEIIKKYKKRYEINQKKVLQLISLYKNSGEDLKRKTSEETKVLSENLLNNNFSLMYDQAVKRLSFKSQFILDLSKIKKEILSKFSKTVANMDLNNKYYLKLLVAELEEIEIKLLSNNINFGRLAELKNISFIDLKTDNEIIKRVFGEDINFNQDEIFIDNDGYFVRAELKSNYIYIYPLESNPKINKFAILNYKDFEQQYTPLSLFLKQGIFIGQTISSEKVVLYANKGFAICYNPLSTRSYFIEKTSTIFSKIFSQQSLNYDSYKNHEFMTSVLEDYFGLDKSFYYNSYKQYKYFNKINNDN